MHDALQFPPPRLAKLLTFAVALPFLPRSVNDVLPFFLVGIGATLLLHALAPNRVRVPLTLRDRVVIAVNLVGVTGLSAALMVHLVKDHLGAVASLAATPVAQLLYVPAWILADEVLFFNIHRFVHTPVVYDKCYKWHHKFKITSVWTSFYAHPLNHTVAVVWAVLAAPLFQIRVLRHEVSAPVLSAFMFGAIATFIASLHAVGRRGGAAEGTDHLEHHKRFRCEEVVHPIVLRTYIHNIVEESLGRELS